MRSIHQSSPQLLLQALVPIGISPHYLCLRRCRRLSFEVAQRTEETIGRVVGKPRVKPLQPSDEVEARAVDFASRFFDRKLAAEEFRRHRNWAAFLAVLIIGVSDILAALGPISLWIAAAGFVGCLAAIIVGSVRTPLAAACRRVVIYGLVVAALASVLHGMHQLYGANRGFLAENIKTVAELQEALGLVRIEQRLEEIKKGQAYSDAEARKRYEDLVAKDQVQIA